MRIFISVIGILVIVILMIWKSQKKEGNPNMRLNMMSLLQKIIDIAAEKGLAKDDISFAQELLNHDEPKLCFDTIITQLYEFDIQIDSHFYDLVKIAANKMRISEKEYSFLKDNIK